VKLTRHARNRLRWIARRHPSVTESALLAALPQAILVGYDDRGNRRVRVALGTIGLMVVIDEAQGVVITMWVE
jgi:hypothetical protein